MKKISASVFLGFLSITLLVSIGPDGEAQAQEKFKESFKLSGLIEEALEKNPGVIAARNRWQSAQDIIEARRALPDPQLTYTYFVENVETRVGPQRHILGAKQKFPFYGKRNLRAEIAAKEAEALKGFYEAVRQEVVRRVKSAFYDLFYLTNIIDITESEREILKRFERIAMTKYESGKGSQQNILKVQVEISKLDDRLLALATQRQTAEALLNRLLDRSSDSPIGKPVQPKFRDFFFIKQELLRLAKQNRPELNAGIALIEKSDKAYSLAKKDYYPDITIGANYIEVDDGPLDVSDNGQDAFNIMFSINVPIWRKKLSSQVNSAFQMIKTEKSNYKETLNRTRFEVEDNYFKIQTARETFSLYKNVLIPQAEQSLKSAEIGYITGIVSFLDLLDAQRILLQIQFGYWKAYADYLKRIADMERAVGIQLPEELPEKEIAPDIVEE